MGPRNLLILFFSTVAVSLVILIIFFSLFFKNVDLNFNTKLPESAPEINGIAGGDNGMPHESKSDGILRSTVNVPPESKEAPAQTATGETEPADSDLPPVSDDAILGDEPPIPGETGKENAVDKTGKPAPDKSGKTTDHTAANPMSPKPADRVSDRRIDRPHPAPTPAPVPVQPAPQPAPDDLQPLVPPVPPQG